MSAPESTRQTWLQRGVIAVLELLDVQAAGKHFLLAAVVGLLAGVAAIVFHVGGQFLQYYTLQQLAGFVPGGAAGEHSTWTATAPAFSPLLTLVVLTTGGLVSGWLVYSLAPDAQGPGTDAAIDAFHNRQGMIDGRVPLVKTIASIVTLSTGGSGGREGPIAQIGAGLGAWFARCLRLSPRQRRILMAAGMGAGVGAIFRAPLAGAVFAGEILYSDADLEADVLVPAATSSIVAYSVFTLALPLETRFLPLFGDQLHHTFSSPMQLIPYFLLAIVLTLAGWVYVHMFFAIGDLFRRLPIRPHFKPAMGALLTGVLAIACWYAVAQNPHMLAVLGTGYGVLQLALTSAVDIGIPMLLLIATIKILTTSLAISSGGAGGVFGPSMVVGGCLGAAVGLALQPIWPQFVAHPEAFAVVGMAGFFAGVARAPLSTIIMVRAMTGDFGLLVPTMFVSTLTFALSHRWSMYRKQVPSRLDSPAHRGDFIVDVLAGMKVADVLERDRPLQIIPEGMTLNEIVHGLSRDHQHYFPVVDADNNMVGIFTDDDVRSYLFDDQLWDLVLARDVMVERYYSVMLDDDLNVALRQFTAKNLDELPVFSRHEPGRLQGMLRRKAVIHAYNQQLWKYKELPE